MNPEDFWKPFECEADSFEEAQELIYRVFEEGPSGTVFAWRGLKDASFALHSSLYRRMLWTSKSLRPPQETQVYKYEARMLADIHRWGLHMAESSRLSVLNQLAILQHYGAPTRLVDVTFNPWIGLWFAVEEQWRDGLQLTDSEETDGRLFAIDVTDRLVNERHEHRKWEDCTSRPWPKPTPGRHRSRATDEETKMFDDWYEWTTATFAWRPPRFHPRIAAQDSGFIFSGVPGSQKPPPSLGRNQWPMDTRGVSKWKIDDVRRATSLALRVHKLGRSGGSRSEKPSYTIRIAADAKRPIRNKLQNLFGYKHSTLFRDFTGFAKFGTQYLRTEPPRVPGDLDPCEDGVDGKITLNRPGFPEGLDP